MNGLLDSVGLSLAFAGVGILLAGFFLTPMREVVLKTLRSRVDQEIPVPPLAVQIPSMPVQMPSMPVHVPSMPVHIPPAPVHMPSPAVQMSSGPQPVWARAAAPEPAAETMTPAQEHEALFARALVTAHKTAEDLVRRASAEAQDIIARAQASADEIVGAARRNATDVLQKAEHEAQLIVEDANERATDRLALLQTEIERLVVDANQAFLGAQHSVEENVASLLSRLEAVTGHAHSAARGGDHASAAGAGSEADGALAWLPPSADERPTVGVGADGRTADHRSRRLT